MEYRFAGEKDLDLLAEWNRQLILDERHSSPVSLLQLRDRMEGKILEGCKAVIFEINQVPSAYALYSEDDQSIHLLHFFVKRDVRRTGIGRGAIDILRKKIFPPQKQLLAEALTDNEAGIQFWQKVGFAESRATMESAPQSDAASRASAKGTTKILDLW